MQTPADLAKLQPEGAVQRLTYVGDAITMMRHMLDGRVPLIGFTGAPVSQQTNFLFSVLLNVECLPFAVDFNGLYD